MDIGIDPILSLVAPLLGDFVGLLLGLYVIFLGQSSSSRPALIRAAFLLGAPLPALARMGGNLVLDSCTGMVPIAGPIIDALFQANLANMQVRPASRNNADPPDPRDVAAPQQVGRHRAATASLVAALLRQA